MGKKPSWRAKAMYLVFAVALVVGLMPLVAAPVLAQPVPITLDPCFDGTWVNVWGANHVVTTEGFGSDATDAFVSWELDSVTPIGSVQISATGGPNGQGQYWCVLDPMSDEDIDATVVFNFTRQGVEGNVSCVKEWHEDCAVSLDDCGRSSEVIWDEAAKLLHGGPVIVKLTDLACDGMIGGFLGDGAVVHWFMVTNPTDCVEWAGDPQATATVDTTIDAVLDPTNPQQAAIADAAADCLGVTTSCAVHYINSVTADNEDLEFQEPDAICEMGHGTSYVSLDAYCEGVTRVAAVVEYPSEFSEEEYKIDCTSINWWTTQRTKVPQVRWAGQKIVLEKNFGFPNHPVCFSLENQSVGALERVSDALPVPGYPQSSDTVWTYTDTNGTARVIVVSEDPGEVDVDLAIYEDLAGEPGELFNEHGFVVYFLKLESITLTEVLGNRTCHDEGLWDLPNPWNPTPLHYKGTATGGTEDTLIDTSNPFTTDLTGQYVAILSGQGAGQVRKITSNTVDTLTVDPCWKASDLDFIPNETSVYQVGGDLFPYYDEDPTTYPDPIDDPAYDTTPLEILNVSQDGLLRVRVEGFFENTNPSMNEGYPWNDIVQQGWVDANRDGTMDMYDYRLPDGRWILPNDWPYLAGIDAELDRAHWNIMDHPNDYVMSAGINGDSELGDYVTWGIGTAPFGRDMPDAPAGGGIDATDPGNPLIAEYPVIGPYNSLDDYTPFVNDKVPTSLFLITGLAQDEFRKTIVRNSEIDEWDTPMPTAKITFEILDGAGFFKEADKGDIYYQFVDVDEPTGDPDLLVYTNPFYAVEVPTHALIPPFINNSEVDWDGWGFINPAYPQGPYDFWTFFNRPAAGDPEQPTRVEVFTDNHGEAMVWINGLSDRQTLIDETVLVGGSNGELDAPTGLRIGNTSVVAYVDYPYITGKHPKLQANELTKTWQWAKSVIGCDPERYPYLGGYSDPFDTTMVFQVGTVLDAPPAEAGLSDKKFAYIWVSDANGQPATGEQVTWTLSHTQGGQAWFGSDTVDPPTSWISSFPPYGVDDHLCTDVTDGFLDGTNGVKEPGAFPQVAVSYLRSPDSCDIELFEKFQELAVWPACLDVDDYAVAGIEIVTSPELTAHYNLTTTIDEGLIIGEIERHTQIRFAEASDTDDPIIRGDADMSDDINMGDVTTVERMVLGLAPESVNADANASGAIDMGDVTMIERMILGQ